MEWVHWPQCPSIVNLKVSKVSPISVLHRAITEVSSEQRTGQHLHKLSPVALLHQMCAGIWRGCDGFVFNAVLNVRVLGPSAKQLLSPIKTLFLSANSPQETDLNYTASETGCNVAGCQFRLNSRKPQLCNRHDTFQPITSLFWLLLICST